MDRDVKVTVYTQTYNAGKYLKECIESILNQTYENFEYIIADHGSTDSTWDTITEYSKKDKRIRTFKFDHSDDIDQIRNLRYEFNGEYYTVLDQDDWYESNYLERMLEIAKKTDADIVNTGSIFFNDKTDEFHRQVMVTPLFIVKNDYDKFYPLYHWFYRQYWGKLVKTEILRRIELPTLNELGIIYGVDTFTSFTLLNSSESIYVDNMALHHYRFHSNSQTRSYTENQTKSDVFLFNFSKNFLSQYGEICNVNKVFIYSVYLNSLNDTFRVLPCASLTKKAVFDEIIYIFKQPATKEALSYTSIISRKDIEKEYSYLFDGLVEISNKILDFLFVYIFTNWKKDIYDLSEIESLFNEYLGDISKVVSCESFEFWVENKNMRKMLLNSDKPGLICGIAEMISKKINTKKYDLDLMLKKLSDGDNILAMINDKMFIRRNFDIYALTVKKKYSTALEKMSNVISSDSNKITETFLNFYLTLSALLNRSDEFVNGKFIAAQYYLRHNKYEKCRETVNDLIEMGFEGDEQIIKIKKELESNE